MYEFINNSNRPVINILQHHDSNSTNRSIAYHPQPKSEQKYPQITLMSINDDFNNLLLSSCSKNSHIRLEHPSFREHALATAHAGPTFFTPDPATTTLNTTHSSSQSSTINPDTTTGSSIPSGPLQRVHHQLKELLAVDLRTAPTTLAPLSVALYSKLLQPLFAYSANIRSSVTFRQ